MNLDLCATRVNLIQSNGIIDVATSRRIHMKGVLFLDGLGACGRNYEILCRESLPARRGVMCEKGRVLCGKIAGGSEDPDKISSGAC
jgi:hypothetical protein